MHTGLRGASSGNTKAQSPTPQSQVQGYRFPIVSAHAPHPHPHGTEMGQPISAQRGTEQVNRGQIWTPIIHQPCLPPAAALLALLPPTHTHTPCSIKASGWLGGKAPVSSPVLPSPGFLQGTPSRIGPFSLMHKYVCSEDIPPDASSKVQSPALLHWARSSSSRDAGPAATSCCLGSSKSLLQVCPSLAGQGRRRPSSEKPCQPRPAPVGMWPEVEPCHLPSSTGSDRLSHQHQHPCTTV